MNNPDGRILCHFFKIHSPGRDKNWSHLFTFNLIYRVLHRLSTIILKDYFSLASSWPK